MFRQIVHFEIDAFLVSVERAFEPALRHRPLIIGGHPGSRARVAAASGEAQRFGVRAGMPLADARRRCPSAAFVAGRFDRYLDAAARIDRLVRGTAPVVEWVSVDEAYLDLSAGRRACRAPLAVAERLQQALKRDFDLDVAAGAGANRLVARMASRLVRPRGLLCVLPGYEARFLAPLRIDLLPDITDKTTRILRTLGLASVGDLAAADPAALEGALGPYARALVRMARGEDDRPVRASGIRRPIRQPSLLQPAGWPAARFRASSPHRLPGREIA